MRAFAYRLITHLSPFCPEPDPLASVDYVSPDEGLTQNVLERVLFCFKLLFCG